MSARNLFHLTEKDRESYCYVLLTSNPFTTLSSSSVVFSRSVVNQIWSSIACAISLEIIQLEFFLEVQLLQTPPSTERKLKLQSYVHFKLLQNEQSMVISIHHSFEQYALHGFHN